MKVHLLRRLSFLLLGTFLVSCSGPQAAATVPPSPTISSTTPGLASSPTVTSTPYPTPTLTPTLVPPGGVCSPLSGIGLEELHSITSNTFSYPSAFTDIGHPGVDLAFFTHGSFTTMYGLPVQSILPGRVTQVIDNRFPYGNMMIIETPLSQLSPELLVSISLPTPIPQQSIDAWSICDKEMTPITWSEDEKSLYILYSHLEYKPEFKPGDVVECGQTIGAVGITGNSVAEHLHIEVRIGPSHAQFGSIATYTQDATPEERYNYCIWSISGIFQATDPALFWKDFD